MPNAMRRPLFLMCAAAAVYVFILQTGNIRADFVWNGAQGPFNPTSNKTCDIQPACVGIAVCVNITPINLIPDGDTQSYTIRSYQGASTFTSGNCTDATDSTCNQYPTNGVACAVVKIYGQNDCNSYVGRKTVYSGNCLPPQQQGN